MDERKIRDRAPQGQDASLTVPRWRELATIVHDCKRRKWIGEWLIGSGFLSSFGLSFVPIQTRESPILMASRAACLMVWVGGVLMASVADKPLTEMPLSELCFLLQGSMEGEKLGILRISIVSELLKVRRVKESTSLPAPLLQVYLDFIFPRLLDATLRYRKQKKLLYQEFDIRKRIEGVDMRSWT